MKAVEGMGSKRGHSGGQPNIIWDVFSLRTLISSIFLECEPEGRECQLNGIR